jgi:alkylation response protein AidB-like acyl-CoA dehydrogenase
LDGLLAAVDTLRPQIVAARDQIERDRRVPTTIVDAMRGAGLFRLCLPYTIGGTEADVETMLRVVEAVSAIDGATGWVEMIGASCGLFAGYLAEQGAEEIFGQDVRLPNAGAAMPKGLARPTPGGYLVNGRWPFASGIHHSAWVFGACFVQDRDGLRLGADGNPEPYMMFVPTADVDILDTWYSGGLRGSDSCDFTITDAFVPEHRVCRLLRPEASSPVYQVSFRVWAPSCVATVALGIARASIDALVGLAETKVPTRRSSQLRTQVLVQVQIAQAEAMLQAARLLFYDAVRDIWDTLTTTGELLRAQNLRLQLASVYAVDTAVQVVDMMHRAGGGTAVYSGSLLERCLRDVHTVSQHAGVGVDHYEAAGRAYLGLDPAPPVA